MKKHECIITVVLSICLVITILYTYKTEGNTDEIEYQVQVMETSMITSEIPEVKPKVIATPSSAEAEYEKGLEYIAWRESLPPAPKFIGVYELTAYEWSDSACANGNFPTLGYTVACNSLPLGTKIRIKGYGDYVVEDRGGMSGNVIDIYMGDVDTCLQFGRQSARIYILEE